MIRRSASAFARPAAGRWVVGSIWLSHYVGVRPALSIKAEPVSHSYARHACRFTQDGQSAEAAAAPSDVPEKVHVLRFGGGLGSAWQGCHSGHT